MIYVFFSIKGFKHLSPFEASGHSITQPAHMPEVSYTSVKKECFTGHHHLHFVSIQHVVTSCMQNRCTVCSTEALHIGCPAPSLFHLQTSPTGTATGTLPLCSCLCSSSGLSQSQRTSGCRRGSDRAVSSLQTFICRRRER